MDDEFNRFRGYGVPPEKNGDYAFLLHIVASLKSTGKGAVILPHGVLFRGNAEAEIRENLIDRKLIKGIIGLPANLFYGTGIPACIIVIDKEGADEREGIFMLDASRGFIKDGNKNRLREQDIYKIVEVFNQQKNKPKYARFVPFDEIKKNEYNLNIPRYIDTQKEEDIQDLNAHLNGGIPNTDIESLNAFWEVYPNLKTSLFKDLRENYSQLNVDKSQIKESIFKHAEFIQYGQQLENTFTAWQDKVYPSLTGIDKQTAPKKLILQISEALLKEYKGKALIDAYDIYQYLRNYWSETMKDDAYLLVEDGWVAQTRRIIEKKKNGKEVVKGWTCDLLPKPYIVDAYFADKKEEIQQLEANLESIQSEISQYEEEHAVEEGLLEEACNDNGKITKTTLTKRMKEVKLDANEKEAYQLMQKVQKLFTQQTTLNTKLKAAIKELDELCYNKYPQLSQQEVKHLVVDKKWLAALKADVQSEIDAISQRLTSRIKELAERYENTMTELDDSTTELEAKVNAHLQKMGLTW